MFSYVKVCSTIYNKQHFATFSSAAHSAGMSAGRKHSRHHPPPPPPRTHAPRETRPKCQGSSKEALDILERPPSGLGHRACDPHLVRYAASAGAAGEGDCFIGQCTRFGFRLPRVRGWVRHTRVAPCRVPLRHHTARRCPPTRWCLRARGRCRLLVGWPSSCTRRLSPCRASARAWGRSRR